MTSAEPLRLLLGPQRPASNLGEAVREAGIGDGRVAVISAAWQEAEGDLDELRALIQRDLVELGLYARTEALLHRDTRLHAAYRARQETLKELQRLYRLRLRSLMIAARHVLRAEGDADLLAAEQRHAIEQIRALDCHHRDRVREIHAAFAEQYHPAHYQALTDQSAEIAALTRDCRALLITGGNVLVLLNRLLLFDTAALFEDLHVIAWSAGAMVLADDIVLFHDRAPLGRRDPELLGPGLGLLPGYVFLPDAEHRLRRGEVLRTGLMSRRFAPGSCVTLDSGSTLRFESDKLVAADATRRLTAKGRHERVRPA